MFLRKLRGGSYRYVTGFARASRSLLRLDGTCIHAKVVTRDQER
jgi:hypothetical protein